MRMGINLKAFELSLQGLKMRYGFPAGKDTEFQQRLELAELQVHLADGNYNDKMIARAIELSHVHGDNTVELEVKLRKMKFENWEEVGSRGRMQVLDQVMDIIKDNLLTDDAQGKKCPDYEKAVDELEEVLAKVDYVKGERGYDEIVKATWVNLREKMYATGLSEMAGGITKERNLREYTRVAKTNAPSPISLSRDKMPMPVRE